MMLEEESQAKRGIAAADMLTVLTKSWWLGDDRVENHVSQQKFCLLMLQSNLITCP